MTEKKRFRFTENSVPWLLLLFTLMAGATPSVVRAAFMASIVLLAPALGREADPATCLLGALMAILFCQPFAAGSASLQLSFAAMAGVLFLTGPIYRWFAAQLAPDREPGAARRPRIYIAR